MPYGSKAFYGVVFGWDFHSIGSGAGRYTLIENRGRNIGGLHFRPRGQGSAQGSRWISLMSVADPAAGRALRRKPRRQGRRRADGVRRPRHPCAVPRRRRCPLRRAQVRHRRSARRSRRGGRVPLARSVHARSEEGGGVLSRPRRIRRHRQGVHAARLRASSLKTGGVTRAVVIPLPKEVAAPGWLPFVQVDDVAATVGRATANGGKVLFAPRPDYFGGHVAVIADPQGGVLGIVNQTEALKKGAAK